MDTKELREIYPPLKVGSQREFDRYMNQLNVWQSQQNRPFLDKLREISRKRELIGVQIEGLKANLKALKIEALDIEQEQKAINRLCHDLKHEMIELNPIGSYPSE